MELISAAVLSDVQLMIVIISAFTFGLTLGYKIGKD